MNQKDLRVIRTRRQVRAAFIELVIERGYEAITVFDIVERAKVGHKTFYRHFEDKEALLYSLMLEILEEGQPLLLPPGSPHATIENTVQVLLLAQKYADLWRVLLRSPLAEQLLQPILVFAESEGKRSFGGANLPDELVAFHFASGMMLLVRWWLEHEQPYTVEQMADYINRLIIKPLQV